MITNIVKFCRYTSKLAYESAYSSTWVCKQQVQTKTKEKNPDAMQEKQSKRPCHQESCNTKCTN